MLVSDDLLPSAKVTKALYAEYCTDTWQASKDVVDLTITGFVAMLHVPYGCCLAACCDLNCSKSFMITGALDLQEVHKHGKANRSNAKTNDPQQEGKAKNKNEADGLGHLTHALWLYCT